MKENKWLKKCTMIIKRTKFSFFKHKTLDFTQALDWFDTYYCKYRLGESYEKLLFNNFTFK